MKYFFLILVISFSHSTSANVLKRARVDSKTVMALSKCKTAVEVIDKEIPDTVACPRVLKFTYKDALTSAELRNIVQEELTFSLTSKTSDWTSIIPESFALQLGFVAETLSEGSGQYTVRTEKKIRKFMDIAESAVAEVSQMLMFKGNALGSKVFTDTQTTWGAKVNAKAVLILNAPLKTVEVYLHGDLDG